MSDQSAWDVAERAANVLAPESDLFADADMAGFGQALTAAARSAGPAGAGAALRLAGGLARVPWVAVSRWLGSSAEPPVAVDGKDRRFLDPAWSDNPLFYATRQSYLLLRRFVGDVLDGAAVDEATVAKARLAVGFPARRVRADEFPADEPGGTQAGVRHRWGECGAGCAAFRG